ncbi:outer membrane protein transport protein [Akkermansiaceae bacterium]|nr:outer membrane protein transport protein [Akkermansiaceae bacterium]MDB4537739.1 outer membrane protein transport protein [Akkermansiaceae bacterium]
MSLPTRIIAGFHIITCPLLAAGYQLSERSASGLGRAFSGESAIGDDASILGSNPAGMSLLDDHSFAFGSTLILPSVDTSGITPFGPVEDRDVIADALVPYLFYSQKINDRLSVGFGSYTTYGLESEYSQPFANSAVVEFSTLRSVNLNPAFSYRLSPQWTIGAGFNALFADGEITSRRPGVGTQLFQLAGDDWGYGYNLGLLYEHAAGTRIGIHFRSAVELSLEGEAEISAGFGAFPPGSYDAGLEIELPDSLEISAYHELNERWAIHADVLWTNWSKFEEFNPKVNPLIDDFYATKENWHNTLRISVGTTYQYNDALTLRAGLAYDESPVDTRYRTLRIPDADRFWASFGVSYKLSESYQLDFGYTHLFSSSVDINRKPNGNEDTFQGAVNGDADLLSLGVSGRF